MIDGEVRTSSRSKTRGPCPVGSIYNYYTAFVIICKGFSYHSLTALVCSGGALYIIIKSFFLKS